MDHAQVKTSETITSKPERKRRAGIFPTVAALTGIGIAALTGCSPDADATPKPTSSTSAEATPSAEPTRPVETPKPSETPTPVETTEPSAYYEFNIPKEKVDQLLAMDNEAFLDLPIEERVLVPLYFAQQLEVQDSMDTYAELSMDSKDKVPSSLSLESSPQDIVSWDGALARIAFWVDDPNDPNQNHFSPDITTKIIAGSAVKGRESAGYSGLIRSMDEMIAKDGGISGSPRSWGVSSFGASGEALSGTEVYEGPGGRPTIDIDIKEQTGITGTISFQWVTLGDYGVWLQL